jgi:hypothetical protein
LLVHVERERETPCICERGCHDAHEDQRTNSASVAEAWLTWELFGEAPGSDSPVGPRGSHTWAAVCFPY